MKEDEDACFVHLQLKLHSSLPLNLSTIILKIRTNFKAGLPNKPSEWELHPMKKTGRKGESMTNTSSGHFWEMGYYRIRKRQWWYTHGL
jgi:hypothetical protein